MLDYQHSTEGGVRSGTQHPGYILVLGRRNVLFADRFDSMWKIGGLLLRTLFLHPERLHNKQAKILQVCQTF